MVLAQRPAIDFSNTSASIVDSARRSSPRHASRSFCAPMTTCFEPPQAPDNRFAHIPQLQDWEPSQAVGSETTNPAY